MRMAMPLQGQGLRPRHSRGRGFRLLTVFWRTRLSVDPEDLEDGYRCWLDREAVLGRAVLHVPAQPNLTDAGMQIRHRLPGSPWMPMANEPSNNPTATCWGRTTEPDMDCSD